MTGPANRGKTAETAVRKVLKSLEAAHMHFTFNRCLDAHAAGGKFPAQAGDFQAFGWTRNWLIEVKEVAHDYRLSHNNFSPESLGRMQKRRLAGSECLVLVHHSGTKLWRAPPFEIFQVRTGGSWDLRGFPTLTLSEALSALCPPNSLAPQ